MNMQNLMAQAQRTAKKEELEKMEFTGKSEWIEMTFTGGRVIKKVKITKEGGIAPEDIEVLEDMIQIATKDAFVQINNAMADKLGQYAGALDGLM